MPYKHIVTLDFETYFSKTYSLKSKDLNTSEYVRHPEFKAQCVAIKVDDEPVCWARDRDVGKLLDSVDWANSALLAHNTAFDGFILGHHYGHRPAYFLDTLSMARALHSNEIGAGLDEVARHYKLGNKLPNVLDKTKGVRDIPDDLMQQLGEYCAMDTELCRRIFDSMIEEFPKEELDLIDLTMRMFVQPILRLDIPRIQRELDAAVNERQRIIEESGIPLKVLNSPKQFSELLLSLGIVPPVKVSKTTGKDTFAFSKQDEEFLELRSHPDEKIRKIIEARLVARSSIRETRAQRFLTNAVKPLPVGLKYYGAHTGRWSGGNKMNLQNLPRKGELRKSIMAPEGHVIVVVDSAQIEARVLAWLAGENKLLTMFRNGIDTYKDMASKIYRIPVEEVDSTERFVGKVATLGLGYGMGAKRFRDTLVTGALGPPIDLPIEDCANIVKLYRSTYGRIRRLWQNLDTVLANMVVKEPAALWPIYTDDEHKLWLPNGMFMHYPGLAITTADTKDGQVNSFEYFDAVQAVRNKMLNLNQAEMSGLGTKIYGGLLAENIVQALARIIIADQMREIDRVLKKRSEMWPGIHKVVTMTHDEIVIVVPEAEGEYMTDILMSIMRVPPWWGKDIPLNCEGGYDEIYSK